MFHQYDHHYSKFINEVNTVDLTEIEKANPHKQITPRYWLNIKYVNSRVGQSTLR